MFAVGETDCELLDGVPTAGMAISPDATRLARLADPGGSQGLGELLVSDASGLLAYRRLDDVREPHSLLWSGSELYAVSTGSNSIAVLDDAGRTMRMLQPLGRAGVGDSCHLNSLIEVDGRLLVSAFGVFDREREWDGEGSMTGRGVVVDADSGEVVLKGLSAPHDPTPVGDGWVICNSHTGEVSLLDGGGRQTKSVHLGGWVRGILVDGPTMYVGVGAHRSTTSTARAHVAVLDTTTLREEGRMALPCRNVFTLLPYHDGLANGLRVGANLGVAGRLGSSAVVIDHPLDTADCAARLTLHAVTPKEATIQLTNLSATVYSSFGRSPVRVGTRWWDETAQTWVDGSRTDLQSPLYPNATADLRVRFTSLPPAGTALQVCVVQEGVRWFDEVSPAAAIEVLPNARSASADPRH